MDLREFVAESLFQIAQGISDAQEKCDKLGARINPAGLEKRVTSEQLFWDEKAGRIFAERIEFDVAVTATKSATAGGKAGISVFGVDVGGDGQRSSTDSTVSRVKFRTLMLLPTRDKPQAT